MNIDTINFISKIAGYAKDRMESGKTLKWAKAYVENNMNAETTEYVHVEGVDFVQVKLALQYLVNETRKERFAYNCSGIVDNMSAAREAAVAQRKAKHVAKKAQEAGVEATVEDVIACSSFDAHSINVQAVVEELKAKASAKPVSNKPEENVSVVVKDKVKEAFEIVVAYHDVRGNTPSLIDVAFAVVENHLTLLDRIEMIKAYNLEPSDKLSLYRAAVHLYKIG